MKCSIPWFNKVSDRTNTIVLYIKGLNVWLDILRVHIFGFDNFISIPS